MRLSKTINPFLVHNRMNCIKKDTFSFYCYFMIKNDLFIDEG